MKNFLILILLLIFYYFIIYKRNVLLLTGSRYIITKDLIKNNNKPTIYICTHTYSFMDVFIICKMSHYFKFNKISTVTNMSKNLIKFSTIINKISRGDDCNFILKGNSLKKLDSLLKKNENIILFIHKCRKSTGLHTLLKNNDVNTTFIKIKLNPECDMPLKIYNNLFDNIFKNNMQVIRLLKQLSGRDYYLSFQNINLKKYIHNNPKHFMEITLNLLYNE